MTGNVSAPQLFSRASDFNINGGTFNSYGPPTIQSVLPPTRNPGISSTSPHAQGDSENLNEIEVYVRLLLRRRRGYLLWNPKPGNWLPLAYRQEGVRIGDVGILTEFGGFDYLFNVCLPADHPVNAGRVPQQFRQLQGIDINNTTWSTEEYKPGSYVASNPSHFSQTKIVSDGAHVSGVPEEFGAGLSFNSSATKGALLIVPEGGKRIDHQQYTKFSRYAAECARSWYTHVNGPSMARGVHNGSLYLVTGCDKARAWGVASFIDAHPSSVSLEFVPKKAPLVGGLPDYVFTKCNYASSSSDADNVFGNQSACMFLRGFKIAVRFLSFLPKISSQIKYISNLNVETLLPRTSRALLPMLTGKRFWASRTGASNSTHEQTDVDSEIDFNFPARYQIYHPSDAINRWILSNYTEVEVVITHDDDWTSVILEDEEQLPDDEELIRRVSNSLEMGNCGYLYVHFRKHSGRFNEPTGDKITSWRETVSTDVLNRIPVDEIRRQEIIQELISRETNYLADLVSLKTEFMGPLLEWLGKRSNDTGASSWSPASSVPDFQPITSSSAPPPILAFTSTIKSLLPLLSSLITSHTHLLETLHVRVRESQDGIIERIGDVYLEKASGEWRAGWCNRWVQDQGFVSIDSRRTGKTGYDDWVAVWSTCGLGGIGVFSSNAGDEVWGNEDWKRIVAEQEICRQNASEGEDDGSHLPNIDLKRFTELLSLPAMHLRSYPDLLSTILAESFPSSSMYPSTSPASAILDLDKRAGKEKEGNPNSSYLRETIQAMRALWGYGKVKTFQLSMNVGANGINGVKGGMGEPAVNWEWFDLVSEEKREEIGKTESKRQTIIFKVIKGEMRYVQDLENVQQMYIIPLLNSSTSSMPIISTTEVNQFISSVFSNINVLRTHHFGLLQSLFQIQYDEYPIIHSISPILDAALNWREAYMEYISNYPTASYLIDSQMRSNPMFKGFVQNCMKHPDAHHLDMKNFIKLPILTLLNYELLLKGILDENPIDDADQKVIPQILDVILRLGNPRGERRLPSSPTHTQGHVSTISTSSINSTASSRRLPATPASVSLGRERAVLGVGLPVNPRPQPSSSPTRDKRERAGRLGHADVPPYLTADYIPTEPSHSQSRPRKRLPSPYQINHGVQVVNEKRSSPSLITTPIPPSSRDAPGLHPSPSPKSGIGMDRYNSTVSTFSTNSTNHNGPDVQGHVIPPIRSLPPRPSYSMPKPDSYYSNPSFGGPSTIVRRPTNILNDDLRDMQTYNKDNVNEHYHQDWTWEYTLDNPDKHNYEDFVNFSLLSHLAVQLRDKVPRELHTKASIPYERAFTGKDIVDTIQALIKKHLLLKHSLNLTAFSSSYPTTAIDRIASLHVSRSLQTQLLFYDVEGKGRELTDGAEDVYLFSDDSARSATSNSSGFALTTVELAIPLPTAVVTMLTRCYVPTCADDTPCYAWNCPKRGQSLHRMLASSSLPLSRPNNNPSSSSDLKVKPTHDLPLFPISIETKTQKHSTQTEAKIIPSSKPIVYNELDGPDLTLRSKITRSVISPPSSPPPDYCSITTWPRNA